MLTVKTFLFSALVFLSSALYAVEPIQTSFLSSTAVSGYDTVAYFTEGVAIKGTKEFAHEWMDAKWLFSSEENLELFKAKPEFFMPQFGGYCAYAVGLGKTARGNPTQFTVVDGKLYLNYNSKTKVLWEDDQEELISAAEKHWPELLAK